MVADPFSFALDSAVLFGAGRRREVGTEAARFARSAALVTGRGWGSDGQRRSSIEQSLRGAGVDVVLVHASAGEPEVDQVREASAAMLAAGAGVVVAIGGGSTLDLAKAAAVTAGPGVKLAALLEGERFDHDIGLPVVALPTTAGSGAEVSRGAIVLDRRSGRKRGIRGRGVAPRVAIVDPELVLSCPPAVTARAGFDAVAHAVETAASRAASPLNRLLSINALRHLLESLPRSLADPANLDARSSASYAALLMGINLATSTTCLPHRMQYPVGALTGSTHAEGVAALMPAWLTTVREVAPERLAFLVDALDLPPSTVTDAADSVAEAVLDLRSRIGLDLRLRDLGVSRSDVPRLRDLVEGAVENDPGRSDPAAIERLYEESF